MRIGILGSGLMGGKLDTLFMEPFSLLVAQLAYEGDAGPQLAYRFEWLGE